MLPLGYENFFYVHIMPFVAYIFLVTAKFVTLSERYRAVSLSEMTGYKLARRHIVRLPLDQI